jgi:hypothetical protein
MYFDNLTIAGLLALVPYVLLPLLFGRETVRVQETEEGVEIPNPTSLSSYARGSRSGGRRHPEPCGRA